MEQEEEWTNISIKIFSETSDFFRFSINKHCGEGMSVRIIQHAADLFYITMMHSMVELTANHNGKDEGLKYLNAMRTHFPQLIDSLEKKFIEECKKNVAF